MKAIRKEYEKQGVDRFYSRNANRYENPHFEQIRQLLIQNKNRIDYTKVLDFGCGGGEVALVLETLDCRNTIGCDPYTYKLFERKTGNKCFRFSFDNVIRKGIMGSYSSIISSFAMHLCPEELLFPLTAQLFLVSKQIVIITPHKRPLLENLSGIELEFEDFSLTRKGKKVRLKSYKQSWG